VHDVTTGTLHELSGHNAMRSFSTAEPRSTRVTSGTIYKLTNWIIRAGRRATRLWDDGSGQVARDAVSTNRPASDERDIRPRLRSGAAGESCTPTRNWSRSWGATICARVDQASGSSAAACAWTNF